MTRKRTYDAEWRKVREFVLARDGHRCQIARPKCRGVATEVDHIVAVSDGGARLDPANLRAACKSCNIAERNATLAQRAKGVRAGASPAEMAPLPARPTRAEYRAWSGYDWPEPPGGWRPE